MNKKILLVFHLNFLRRDQGCCTNVFEITKYLRGKNFDIDFLSTEAIWKEHFNDLDILNNKYKMLNNVFLLKNESTLKKRISKIKKFFLKKYYSKKFYSNWVNNRFVNFFQQVIDSNNYDFIYIHYIQFADLIKFANVEKKIKLIYSMHDADFIQVYYNNRNMFVQKLQNEISLINMFDCVMAISNDEKEFFRKFCDHPKFYHLPHPLNKIQLHKREKDIDIMFLGFSNPFNLEAVFWFIDNVMPFLKNRKKIYLVGNVTNDIKYLHLNYYDKIKEYKINIIEYFEDLDELYARTRVAIVPMINGTGMKIKTIEAMARSIPVVSTSSGVDGFADKNESGCLVTDKPEKFANYIDMLLDDKRFYRQVVEKQDYYFDKYLSLSANSQILDEVFGAGD